MLSHYKILNSQSITIDFPVNPGTFPTGRLGISPKPPGGSALGAGTLGGRQRRLRRRGLGGQQLLPHDQSFSGTATGHLGEAGEPFGTWRDDGSGNIPLK